jgi:broad specificity phosphatase PhoE
VKERMKVVKESRERFGRFFYRFPEGESAADVFDRVSGMFLSVRFV